MGIEKKNNKKGRTFYTKKQTKEFIAHSLQKWWHVNDTHAYLCTMLKIKVHRTKFGIDCERH